MLCARRCHAANREHLRGLQAYALPKLLITGVFSKWPKVIARWLGKLSLVEPPRLFTTLFDDESLLVPKATALFATS